MSRRTVMPKHNLRILRIGTGFVAAALLAILVTTGPAAGQAAPAAAVANRTVLTHGLFRYLAPGVMKVVDAEPQIEETFALHDVVELLAIDPSWEWAKDVSFHRDVWHLDFQFKPLRYIWVDIPQPTGKMQRKLIRYLVYSVTNPGNTMHPVVNADGTIDRKEDGTYDVQYIEKPIRFLPEFLLEGLKDGKTLVYPDRIVPMALIPIRLREDPNRKFYASTEIALSDIPPHETRWGVATWIDTDPQITRFSIYIQGLTNAYHWYDEPGLFKPGDRLGTGRALSRKTLKLNFWRAGDEFYEHEEEVHYGYPGELDYEWVYR